MGPIKDECGVEQGGINSSDLYKIYNNDQLDIAQASEFGVELGPLVISAIGQAEMLPCYPLTYMPCKALQIYLSTTVRSTVYH